MQVIVANYQLLLAVQCQIEEFCQSSLGCATQSREHAVPDPSQRTNHQSHFIYIDQKQHLYMTLWCFQQENSHLQPWQKAIYMRLQRKSTNTTSKWTIVSVPPKPNKHHKNEGHNLECHTVPDHPLHHEWQWLAAISPNQPSASHECPLLYDTLQTIIQKSTPGGFCSISGWNSNTVSWC